MEIFCADQRAKIPGFSHTRPCRDGSLGTSLGLRVGHEVQVPSFRVGPQSGLGQSSSWIIAFWREGDQGLWIHQWNTIPIPSPNSRQTAFSFQISLFRNLDSEAVDFVHFHTRLFRDETHAATDDMLWQSGEFTFPRTGN